MSATLEAISQRAAARSIAERARKLVTVLNLHFAGVAVLALINLYLVAHMVFAYQQVHSQNEDAVAQQRMLLQGAELAARPLEGLDAKLTTANAEADSFYQRRLPSAYSQFLAELGAQANKEHVKLSSNQYAQATVLGGTPGELTEVKMDANLSGDYRALVMFLNALERDKMFFLVNNIALTGQQSGTVNLRMRLTTYLRARAAGEALPPLQTSSDAAAEDVAPSTPAPAARANVGVRR
jgi:type IV pilus assembly protein PilO